MRYASHTDELTIKSKRMGRKVMCASCWRRIKPGEYRFVSLGAHTYCARCTDEIKGLST